jgi:hypothetical protein
LRQAEIAAGIREAADAHCAAKSQTAVRRSFTARRARSPTRRQARGDMNEHRLECVAGRPGHGEWVGRSYPDFEPAERERSMARQPGREARGGPSFSPHVRREGAGSPRRGSRHPVRPDAFMTSRNSIATAPSASTLAVQINISQPMRRSHAGLGVTWLAAISGNPRRARPCPGTRSRTTQCMRG